MSASLGTASLALVVNGQQYTLQLKQKEKETETWAQRLGKKIKGVAGKAAGSIMSGIGAGIGFGMAKLGVDSISGMLESGIEKLKELRDVGEYAQALGTTGEEMSRLAGLAKYAGTDIRQVMEGLATLNKMIGEAGKGGEADKLFASLNVNAKEFASLNAHDQFFKLFETLQKGDDPMRKFMQLMDATGEDVGKLMVKLNRFSSSELQELANRFTVSNAEIAHATVATESLEAAQLKLDQATGKLAVAFAPLVSVLADKLVEALNGGQNAFSQFGNAVIPIMKNVAYAIANVVDVVQGIGNILTVSAAGWQTLGGAAWATIGKLSGNDKMQEEGLKLIADADKYGKEALKRLVEGDNWAVTNALGKLMNLQLDQFDQKVKAVEKRLAAKPKPNNADIKKAEELAVKPYEAIIQGSKEAARAMGRWNAGIPLDDIPKQQLKEQKKGNDILKNIDANTKRKPNVGIM